MNARDIGSLCTRRRRRLAAMLCATALAAPCAVTPALAQSAAEAAVDDNTIIVTAQRREEALEDVPMTVAVVSQETLTNAGVTSVRDLAKVVTGFQLGQGGAFPQPAVRGITTIINGTSFENNVAVYVDGFYEVAPQAINIDLPNISDVQVLKGPQGTLYGRNATGGAILLNTVSPTQEWHGRAELTYARFDDKRASGYVAGPLSEMIGVSVAGYIRRSDGYIKLTSRTTPGALDGNAAPLEQDAVRVKLVAQFSENLKATLGYNYTHISDARGNMFSVFENVLPSFFANPALPGGLTRPTKFGTAAWDIDARVETRAHQGTLKLELDTGIGKLTSYTGYTTFKPVTSFDFDGSYINSRWSTSVFRQKTFQQAVDYTIDAVENVDLILGGTYFRDDLRDIPPHLASYLGLNQTAPGTTPPTSANLVQSEDRRFRQKKDAWAVYADVTFHPADQLSINVGGRYSEETQDVFGRSICFITPVTTATDTCRAILPDASGNRYSFPETSKSSKYSKFTPRASIRYEIAPRTNVYVSYSKGFRSGAWNASLPLLAPVGSGCVATPATPCVLSGGPPSWFDAKQEEIDSFEAGFKTAGRAYRFELSGFYYKYKNLQVSYTTLVNGVTATIVSNAPRAKIYGIEGAFEWEPLENLKLRGGAAWLHARYGDGFILKGVTGVNPAIAALTNNPGDPLTAALNVTQDQDLSGLQMARAPNFTANFGAEYNIPDREGGLRISANINYTDSYVVTNPAVWGPLAGPRAREQRFRQDGYALLSAQVTWTEPGGHFYAQAFGTNLTNHRYKLHYTGTAFGSYAPMAEPAVYGGRVGYKF